MTYITVCSGGCNSTTNEVNRLLATLPPAVQALTGVDLSGVSIYNKNLKIILKFDFSL